MRTEIICTGDEVLTGKIVNTNFTYITQKFEDHGLSVKWETTVGDDREDLLQAFRAAGERADAVIVNGGLGPTVDDLSQGSGRAGGGGGTGTARGLAGAHERDVCAAWAHDVAEQRQSRPCCPLGPSSLTIEWERLAASASPLERRGFILRPACHANCGPCWSTKFCRASFSAAAARP